MACLLSWMSGKETSAKITLFSQGERLMKNIIEDSSSYLFLMLVFRINPFSMMKEKLGVKERWVYYQDQAELINSKKVTIKKKVKFAILLDGLLICLFQFSY